MKNSRRTKQATLTGQVGGLVKGRGRSMDDFRKELLKTAFVMRLSGKSEKEILKWLENKT